MEEMQQQSKAGTDEGDTAEDAIIEIITGTRAQEQANPRYL